MNARRHIGVSDVALRRVRVAIRDGRVPTVRESRRAIAFCARAVERYADEPETVAAFAAEALRLAPFAASRAAVQA